MLFRSDEEGSVLDGPHYALVCRQLGVPVRVYRVASDAVETAQRAFEQQYGAYSYRHIDKKPYIQSFAQPKRDGSSTPVFSRLYKERIVPVAKAGKRVLDFGCGGGAPVRRLQAMGCRVQGIEFFPRRPGTEALDTVLSRAMIGSALRDLQVNGRFDAVICDFVVNSVQTPEAEEDVMTLVNAFCRPGGLICASGRRMANEDKVHKTTKQADADHRRRHHFFDEHGFTAKLGRGQWFFQRFHTDDEANAYPARYGYDGEADVRLDGEQWFSAGYKTRDLDEARVIEALAREFDLEWPNGQRVGRAETALAAWAAAMGREKH